MYTCYSLFYSSWNPLKLGEGSVSDGESDGKRNNASDKSGAVSNDSSIANIGGLGSDRGQSSGEGGNLGNPFPHDRLLLLGCGSHLDTSDPGRRVGDRGEGGCAGHEDRKEGNLKLGHFELVVENCEKESLATAGRHSAMKISAPSHDVRLFVRDLETSRTLVNEVECGVLRR